MQGDVPQPHPWLASILRPVCEGNLEDAEAYWNRLHRGIRLIGVFATGDPVPAVLEALPEFPDVLESAHNYLSQIPLIEEN